MSFLASLYNPPDPKITLGAWYRIRKYDGSGASWTIRCRAIWKNDRLVVFETEKGVRESWTFWELARCLV